MPTHATDALIEAIVGECLADGGLVAALGGERIYDAVPKNAVFPYVTIGEARALDWSTATEDGTEHLVALDVWSRARGRREAVDLANRIALLIDDQPLVLTGHRLVNLRVERIDTRRLRDGRTFRAALSLRAVTEPV